MQNKAKFFYEIILALVFIAIAGFLFLYILQRLEAKNTNAIYLASLAQSQIIHRQKIANMNSEVKSVAPERAKLDSHFAKSSDVVPFLDTLQELSVQAGSPAEFSSVNLSKDGKSLEVSMKAEGTFISVHKFLSLLENSSYEFDFSSVNLQKKVLSDAEKVAGKDSVWTMDFKFSLLSFIQ